MRFPAGAAECQVKKPVELHTASKQILRNEPPQSCAMHAVTTLDDARPGGRWMALPKLPMSDLTDLVNGTRVVSTSRGARPDGCLQARPFCECRFQFLSFEDCLLQYYSRNVGTGSASNIEFLEASRLRLHPSGTSSLSCRDLTRSRTVWPKGWAAQTSLTSRRDSRHRHLPRLSRKSAPDTDVYGGGEHGGIGCANSAHLAT